MSPRAECPPGHLALGHKAVKASAHSADQFKGTPFFVLGHAAVQQFQRNDEYTACSTRQDPKIVERSVCVHLHLLNE